MAPPQQQLSEATLNFLAILVPKVCANDSCVRVIESQVEDAPTVINQWLSDAIQVLPNGNFKASLERNMTAVVSQLIILAKSELAKASSDTKSRELCSVDSIEESWLELSSGNADNLASRFAEIPALSTPSLLLKHHKVKEPSAIRSLKQACIAANLIVDCAVKDFTTKSRDQYVSSLCNVAEKMLKIGKKDNAKRPFKQMAELLHRMYANCLISKTSIVASETNFHVRQADSLTTEGEDDDLISLLLSYALLCAKIACDYDETRSESSDCTSEDSDDDDSAASLTKTADVLFEILLQNTMQCPVRAVGVINSESMTSSSIKLMLLKRFVKLNLSQEKSCSESFYLKALLALKYASEANLELRTCAASLPRMPESLSSSLSQEIIRDIEALNFANLSKEMLLSQGEKKPLVEENDVPLFFSDTTAAAEVNPTKRQRCL